MLQARWRAKERTFYIGEWHFHPVNHVEPSSEDFGQIIKILCRFTNGVQTIRFIISLQGLMGNIIGSGRSLLTMEGGKPEGEKEFIDAVCGPASMPGVNFRRLLAAMKKGAIEIGRAHV